MGLRRHPTATASTAIPQDLTISADLNIMTPEGYESSCVRCGHEAAAWITTCANCGASIRRGETTPNLANEPAPPLESETRWIDIPISADEPVRVALFCHFLNERSFTFEESRRFVSIPVEEASAIEEAIAPWAFEHDLPEDPRVHDSLADTLRAIGQITLNAIDGHRSLQGAPKRKGIDLR